VLPAGRSVLATRPAGAADGRLEALDLGTGQRKILVEGGGYGRYAASGHLVYAREATLMAVPFDAASLEVRGQPVPVVEGVARIGTGAAAFSISRDGVLAYLPGGAARIDRRLVRVDRQGKAQPFTAIPRSYIVPKWSPDGRRIAVSLTEGPGQPDIWVYEPARDTLTRLTFDPAIDGTPVWTPDGKRIVFYSARAGPPNLFWKAADGSGPDERLTESPQPERAASFSPDGKLLLFEQTHPTNLEDLWVLPMDGERKPRPILQTTFAERMPRLSPDGRWLAYVSNESGTDQVYVQPFSQGGAPGGGKWQISSDGGDEPVWARSGRELFYRAENRIMVVDLAASSSFQPGKPRLLFEGRYAKLSNFGSYDVTPDGKSFVFVESGEGESQQELIIVLNWFEELKRKAPVRR